MTTPLTPAEAIRQAVAEAGLDDFGPDSFRDGLQYMLATFAGLPLTVSARTAAEAKVVRDLVTRLRIEQYYKDRPEIADQPVEDPVFVVGMPRTGTTATVAMLALDDRFRFLRGWEGASPLPPPVAGEEDADPRVIAARAAAQAYKQSHIHLLDPDGPEEDLALLSGLDMHSYHGVYPMPDAYLSWWYESDFAPTYAYIERVLKLLHSRRPPHRWLLKSPPHLFNLDVLARQYPTARFVMTHRHPLKLIPSVASLHCTLHGERCTPGSFDKQEVGRRHFAFWVEGMRRGLAARAAIGEGRFVDVRNDDLIRQPLAEFERIYAHVGLDLSEAQRQRLQDYSTNNAPGTFGQHAYTLEEYGLAATSIRAAFKEYSERFGLDGA